MDSIVGVWGESVKGSFLELWFAFLSILPSILGAIAIFIFGLFVSEIVGRLATKILENLRLDAGVEKSGAKIILERIGLKMKVSKVLGLLVTWFLYLVFLIAIADVLKLTQVTDFLKAVVLYLPNVLISVIILIVGTLLAGLAGRAVRETASAAKYRHADIVAAVAKWSILIFTLMVALNQLNIASDMIQVLFTGVVFMFALAGGLAFGLGGKDKAAELLKKITKNGK